MRHTKDETWHLQDRGTKLMNENEKEIFKSMAEYLDDLPEMKKGEFIGYAKCMADIKRVSGKQTDEQQPKKTGLGKEGEKDGNKKARNRFR